jgi:hypothetical protein
MKVISPAEDSSTVNKGSGACLEKLPDYEVLRSNNMNQINNYYEDLLTNYSANYSDYVKNSAGNVSDRSYAETQLKPKTLNYNNQMIALNQKMIDSINDDTNNILELKNQLDEKINKIDKLTNQQKQLKESESSLQIEYKSRRDNLNTTKQGLHDIKFWNYIFIGINIILLLIVLGSIIYLIFYKNGTTNQSNNNTSSTANISITSNKMIPSKSSNSSNNISRKNA